MLLIMLTILDDPLKLFKFCKNHKTQYLDDFDETAPSLALKEFTRAHHLYLYESQ